MDRLTSMETFVRVAEAGSFSAAARQIGVGQSAVSKMIAMLEERLGARLVTRSTRRLSLTEDGRRYLEAARVAIEAAQAADQLVGDRAVKPSGRLRVAASIAFGRLHIVPRLAQFFESYSDIDVELLLSDRFVDMIGEGVEVAIRIGTLSDPGLVARRIGSISRITVARPEYWEARGRPERPEDLTAHECLIYTELAKADLWEFQSLDGPISVKVAGRFRTNCSDAMREALLAGLGVGVTPYWMWRDELAEGRLERVLTAYEPTPRPVQAVFPERRLISPKVRAFVDFLTEQFRNEPSLSSSVFGSGGASCAPVRSVALAAAAPKTTVSASAKPL